MLLFNGQNQDTLFFFGWKMCFEHNSVNRHSETVQPYETHVWLQTLYRTLASRGLLDYESF